MNIEKFKSFNEALLGQLRANRNLLLRETDWTQMPDAPLSEEKKSEYANYRQSLRDITLNVIDPTNVVWPTKPA